MSLTDEGPVTDCASCCNCGQTVAPAPAAGPVLCTTCTAERTMPTRVRSEGAPLPYKPCVPGYDILGELGRGAMGIVYVARQVGLDRLVALKVLLGHGTASEGDLARFRAEAMALARLAHPHIVRIYEIGELKGGTHPLPYLSLEYCGGGSLEKRLAGEPLRPKEAAILVRKLAEAMQVAHDARVIHRDLKPANVLLMPDGTPRITDFGVARRLDDARVTQTGVLLGTPPYMAPEQAQGERDVGPACDVYALGAILYECLTGRPPFRAANILDTLAQVVAQDPVPPTQFDAAIPRDLETITLKCLQKAPARRYASAADLADDLGRFLDRKPIRARPVGWMERFNRWERRNPAIAALVVALFVSLIVGTTVATLFALHAFNNARRAAANESTARQHATQADKHARHAQRSLYVANLQLAGDAYREGQTVRLLELLDEVKPTGNEPDLRGFEWHFLRRNLHPGARTWWLDTPDPAAAIARDGRVFAVTKEGLLEIDPLRDTRRRVPGSAVVPGTGSIALAVSADGHRLAVHQDGAVSIRDTATGSVLQRWEGQHPTQMELDAQGRHLLVSLADDRVLLLDVDSGDALWQHAAKTAAGAPIALSGDARRAVVTQLEYKVTFLEVHDPIENRLLWREPLRDGAVRFSLSEDGEKLAISLLPDDGIPVDIWDLSRRRREQQMKLPCGDLPAVGAIRLCGEQLLVSEGGGNVSIWDVARGKKVASHHGHVGPVRQLARVEGDRLLSVGDGGTVKLWGGPRAGNGVVVGRQGGKCSHLLFTGDGKHFISAGGSEGNLALSIREAVTGRELRSIQPAGSTLFHLDATKDGRLLVGATCAGVRVWEIPSGKERFCIGRTGVRTEMALSHDGRWLAHVEPVADLFQLTVTDLRTGKAVFQTTRPGKAPSLAFSPDDQVLAMSVELKEENIKGQVHCWEISGWKERPSFQHNEPLSLVGFRTGSELLVRSGLVTLMSLDLRSNGLCVLKKPPARWVPEIMSHSGRWVAGPTVSPASKPWLRGGLVIYDVHEQSARLHPGGHAARACTPDGTRLVSLGSDGNLRVVELATGRELLALFAYGRDPEQLAINPDGTLLATAGEDGVLKLWDARPLDPVEEQRRQQLRSLPGD